MKLSIALITLLAITSAGAQDMQRKYTVQEIDELRRAVENKYLWGRYTFMGTNGMSRSYIEQDKVKAVEEMTRTFMLNGQTAQDLYESEKR